MTSYLGWFCKAASSEMCLCFIFCANCSEFEYLGERRHTFWYPQEYPRLQQSCQHWVARCIANRSLSFQQAELERKNFWTRLSAILEWYSASRVPLNFTKFGAHPMKRSSERTAWWERFLVCPIRIWNQKRFLAWIEWFLFFLKLLSRSFSS